MIISMTGFSSRIVTITHSFLEEGREQELHFTLLLKTLNSRFFEATCKLPYSLAFLETDLIKYFKKRLLRGTVHFSLYASSPAMISGTIKPSLATIKGYLESCKAIKESFNLEGTVSLSTLLTLPDIFETKEAPLEKALVEKIMASIAELTDDCIASKIEEGRFLERDILERLDHVEKAMQQLEPHSKKVIAQKKEQLISSLKEFLKETHQESPSEGQSITLFNQLERLDIHEEIERFKNHLQKMRAIIVSEEQETGKRLDFTLQELFREINTIGSKCQDSVIGSLAISIKVELEKAREQVQNAV